MNILRRDNKGKIQGMWKSRIWMVCVLNFVVSSSLKFPLEEYGHIKLEGDDRVVVFPFLFRGNKMVLTPTTRFKDLKSEEKDHIKSFIKGGLLRIIWDYKFGQPVDKNYIYDHFKNDILKYLNAVSLDVCNIYTERNITFSSLLLITYEKMFLNLKRPFDRELTKIGKKIISMVNSQGVEEVMRRAKGSPDEEKVKNMVEKAKACGEYFCNLEAWEKTVEVEKIIWKGWVELYKVLPEVELMGLLMEGCGRKMILEKLGVERINTRYFLEYGAINYQLLLWINKKWGQDWIKKLIKQMMIEGGRRRIDLEYINKMVFKLEKKEKKEIERSIKNGRKLMEDEEREKKGKEKKGKEKKKEVGGEEEEKEEAVERVEYRDIPSVSKEEGNKKNYKLHKRVARWSKDAEKIKEELDRGKEKSGGGER
ncbi:immunoglobulin G-binding protein A-like protein [Encephalitozoon intestinalis]|nr:immunoglobulin G-binding protein A-like protein [Encephalitozoon intestinalis]